MPPATTFFQERALPRGQTFAGGARLGQADAALLLPLRRISRRRQLIIGSFARQARAAQENEPIRQQAEQRHDDEDDDTGQHAGGSSSGS